MLKIKRYDILLVDFYGNIGSEQGGKRPAVVVQNNVGNTYSTTTLVIPLTSKQNKHLIPTHTLVRKGRGTGLKVDSVVLGEQMRAIDEQRVIKKIGSVTNQDEIQAIRNVYLNNMEYGE